jgi:hypothetical protein
VNRDDDYDEEKERAHIITLLFEDNGSDSSRFTEIPDAYYLSLMRDRDRERERGIGHMF